MRCVGTVVRGIRTPIIKEDTKLVDVVIDSLMKAKESEGFEFRDKDIIAVNPGSMTYPRQEGRRPSYIIMELDGEGNAHFTINYME